MGTCKFCGKDAGLFSHSHKECEKKHTVGVSELSTVLNAYFAGRTTAAGLTQKITQLKIDNYINEEDICKVSDREIRHYTASIQRPYRPSAMQPVDEYLNATGVPYNKINANGAVDDFAKKLMRSFMVDYFTDQLTLQQAHARCEKVLAKFPMNQDNINDAYFYVLNKAATNFLKNGLISDDEQRKIDDYVQFLSLPVNNPPAKYQNSEITKLSQAVILKNLQNGVVPRSNSVSAPILLGKNENILWSFNGVTLYQEKITKEWVGRSGGFSFRVMKGVYYRTGQSKGHPVEHSSMEKQGTGFLFVTNKNLIFYSAQKSAKVPYNKIIGITPYSDGIEVHKDGANQKRMTMQGFDPWFLMNVLSLINA